jgi:hypothetical protein
MNLLFVKGDKFTGARPEIRPKGSPPTKEILKEMKEWREQKWNTNYYFVLLWQLFVLLL